MTTAIHQGHVELGDSQLGATLRLEPGRVTLEIASTGGTPNMPERLEILLFTSSTGYFTLTDLYRHNHSMRLGVGGLSTYSARLAFEILKAQVAEAGVRGVGHAALHWAEPLARPVPKCGASRERRGGAGAPGVPRG